MNSPNNEHGYIQHQPQQQQQPLMQSSVQGPMYVAQLPPPQGGYTPGGGPQSRVQRSVISVEEVLRYIRKYWILATLAGLCAGIGIFIFLQNRPPVYESTSVILLNNNVGKELNLKTVEPTERSEYNLPQLVNNLKNEIATDKFRISYYNVISPELRAKVIGKVSPENRGRPEEHLFLSGLEKMISVDVIKDSHMVSVTAKASDRDTAAEVANTYVSHFSNYVREQEHELTRKVVKFLKSKADGLLTQVKEQEAKLLVYREKKGVTNGQGESDFIANKITVLNTQLAEARLQEERLRDILTAVGEVGEDPEEILKVPAFAENDTLEKAYEKLSEARARVAELRTDYGKKHPTMINAVSLEKSARETLSKLVVQSVSSLRRQRASSDNKIASLESRVKAAKAEMVTAGNTSVSQQLMEEQLKASRELYNSLILQMNEATLSLQFSGVDRVRITEDAIAQKDPVFPSKALSAVVGTVAFASCFLGIPLTLGFGQRIIAMSREAGDDDDYSEEIQAPIDPARTLPVYTQASYAPPQPQSQAGYHAGFATLVSFPPVAGSDAGPWVRRVTDISTRSGADLNRFVAQTIQLTPPGGGLIITSENVNPAKTLTAAAVCLAACRQGLTTLLVSSEKLVPSIEPRLRKGNYQTGSGQPAKSTEELLSPFGTDEPNLYFITDDAWKRIPLLCLETLCSAQQCVDLVVLDAPLVPDETSLKVMAQFATRCVLVRGETEFFNFPELQGRLQRTMPNCTVVGEFTVSG